MRIEVAYINLFTYSKNFKLDSLFIGLFIKEYQHGMKERGQYESVTNIFFVFKLIVREI